MNYIKLFETKSVYDSYKITIILEKIYKIPIKRDYKSNKPILIYVEENNYIKALDIISRYLIRRNPEETVMWVDLNENKHLYSELVLGNLKVNLEEFNKEGNSFVEQLFNKKYKIEKTNSNFLIVKNIFDPNNKNIDYLCEIGKKIRYNSLEEIQEEENAKLQNFIDENYDNLAPYVYGYDQVDITGKILIK